MKGIDRWSRSQGRKVHEQIPREGGQISEEEGELAGRPSKGGPDKGSNMEEATALKGKHQEEKEKWK